MGKEYTTLRRGGEFPNKKRRRRRRGFLWLNPKMKETNREGGKRKGRYYTKHKTRRHRPPPHPPPPSAAARRHRPPRIAKNMCAHTAHVVSHMWTICNNFSARNGNVGDKIVIRTMVFSTLRFLLLIFFVSKPCMTFKTLANSVFPFSLLDESGQPSLFAAREASTHAKRENNKIRGENHNFVLV